MDMLAREVINGLVSILLVICISDDFTFPFQSQMPYNDSVVCLYKNEWQHSKAKFRVIKTLPWQEHSFEWIPVAHNAFKGHSGASLSSAQQDWWARH